jgi:hypothetical protein
MIFKYLEIENRKILQTDETNPDFVAWKAQGGQAHYDSFIMSQRGQDFDAKHAELIEQGHTIEVILPEVVTPE